MAPRYIPESLAFYYDKRVRLTAYIRACGVSLTALPTNFNLVSMFLGDVVEWFLLAEPHLGFSMISKPKRPCASLTYIFAKCFQLEANRLFQHQCRIDSITELAYSQRT